MMKILYILLLLLIPGSCLTENKNNNISIIPYSVKDFYWNYDLTLKEKIKGNYTNSGYDEYLCVYYIKPDKNSEITRLFFYQMMVYVLKDNKIINSYPIDVNSGNYNSNKINLSPIKDLENEFGKWNGYFLKYDFNRNGIDELFIFTLTLEYTLNIYEFRKNKFINVLADSNMPEFVTNIKTDKDSKTIIIYSGNDSYKFRWAGGKGKYVYIK